MDTVLSQQLLANTFSTAAAYARLGLCRTIIEEVVYSDDQSQKSHRYNALLETYTTDDGRAVAAWGAAWVDDITIENFHSTMESLSAWVETLPTFTVYIPTALEEQGEAIIGHWCREHVAPNVLVDFKVDPNVVGGCAFIHEGAYHDCSLTSRSDAFAETITQTVRSYE